MKKLNIFLCLSTALLVGIFSFGWVSVSQSPQPEVRLVTEPTLGQLTPFEAESEKNEPPVKLSLQALDKAGRPLANAKMHLQIFTPSPTPWFTTDFPIVEGTKLLDIEAIAPKGEMQIQQMLPIRGSYNLLVAVKPLTGSEFTPFQQNLSISLSENSLKYRNFGILMAVLLAVGLVGGWVIGGRQQLQAGEIAPQNVRFLLSGLVVVAIVALLAINVSAEVAQSQMSMPMSHMTHMTPGNDRESAGIAESQGLKLQLSGDKSATVGNVANFQARLLDSKTGQPVSDAMFALKVTQLEKDWVAFASTVPAFLGQVAWQQEFFDGAPHKVEVEVSPQPNAVRQFQPFKVMQEVEVEGVAPPLTVRLITLFYFTSVVAIGLAIGLFVKRRRSRAQVAI